MGVVIDRFGFLGPSETTPGVEWLAWRVSLVVVVRGDGVIDILLEGPLGSLKASDSAKFRAELGIGTSGNASGTSTLLAVRGLDRSEGGVCVPFNTESLLP